MIQVEIAIEEKLWRREKCALKKNLRFLIGKIIPQTSLFSILEQNIAIEISLLLTGDEAIRKLNREYRDKDKATNVLSFPAFDLKNPGIFAINKLPIIDNSLMLGDIVLSYQTIKNEAGKQNKTFENHLTHLLIHSILHLIGYDHQMVKQARQMEALEIKMLKTLAIPNPYVID